VKVCDLHCDLLVHLLNHPKSNAYDPESRVSIPQMKQGGVVLQTFAIFKETKPGCSVAGEKEFQIFKSLPIQYADVFPKDIRPLLAIENASVFCDESESLDEGLARLERWAREAGPISYISLTWDSENRFGGGNESNKGLKPDGKALLRWMDGKQIALDFSHTSDALAHDLFNQIDKLGLKIKPVASHSNFRKIVNLPRNLPDSIAKEIIRRKGVIGLNFVRRLVGSNPEDFLRHVEHAENLGGLDHLCFGADFFNDSGPRQHPKPSYIAGFDNASCYPRLIELFRTILSEGQIEKIASGNLLQFLQIQIK